METILSLKEVAVSYDKKETISGITMDIPKNKITAIIGPSGCGKSTLLHCLNGMIQSVPGAKMCGEIQLDGKDVQAFSQEDLKKEVGLVFQTPTPFPFSIYKNMTYALKYYGIRDKKKLDDLVTEKLKLTGLYEEIQEDLGKNARKLSGGQQQRLCIARALTVEPSVLLLDEPCSALDVKSTAVIEELLLKLKQSYTIVIVTHNIAQAKRISDYVAFMNEGRLVESGDAKTLFTEPKEEETKEFLLTGLGAS